MALTKAKMIEEIVTRNGFSRDRSTEVVEALLEIMKNSLASGEDVLVSGFGRFCIQDKKQRRGRNPATGNSMKIRPRRVAKFRCSGKLRNHLNKQ